MSRSIAFTAAAVALLAPAAVRAHCDTLDGPVVRTARAALDSGKLNPLLAWVRPADEAEVRTAFQKARAARRLGPDAKDVADRWFFETVVRIHRAGEGAPFTGLKPAGAEADPAVLAADRAMESSSSAELEKLLVESVRKGLGTRYARLRSLRPPGEDVAAGREWVEAYVELVHYAERVNAAAGPAGEARHRDERASSEHRH